MPTYDYKCGACGHAFEAFQSMRDPVKRKCPECGKSALDRLIGVGAGVIFKGGGFYETDYRSDSYRKGAESEKKASENTGDSKSDSKGGAKTDGAPSKASGSESGGGSCACGKKSAADCASSIPEKPSTSAPKKRRKDA
jgi:putative FmdB family regulatory protein